jgi:hypothetical protein
LSLKNECTRIILVPLRTDAFHQELTCFANGYNQSRPHPSLNRKTPHFAGPPHELLISPAEKNRCIGPDDLPCA